MLESLPLEEFRNRPGSGIIRYLTKFLKVVSGSFFRVTKGKPLLTREYLNCERLERFEDALIVSDEQVQALVNLESRPDECIGKKPVD